MGSQVSAVAGTIVGAPTPPNASPANAQKQVRRRGSHRGTSNKELLLDVELGGGPRILRTGAMDDPMSPIRIAADLETPASIEGGEGGGGGGGNGGTGSGIVRAMTEKMSGFFGGEASTTGGTWNRGSAASLWSTPAQTLDAVGAQNGGRGNVFETVLSWERCTAEVGSLSLLPIRELTPNTVGHSEMEEPENGKTGKALDLELMESGLDEKSLNSLPRSGIAQSLNQTSSFALPTATVDTFDPNARKSDFPSAPRGTSALDVGRAPGMPTVTSYSSNSFFTLPGPSMQPRPPLPDIPQQRTPSSPLLQHHAPSQQPQPPRDAWGTSSLGPLGSRPEQGPCSKAQVPTPAPDSSVEDMSKKVKAPVISRAIAVPSLLRIPSEMEAAAHAPAPASARVASAAPKRPAIHKFNSCSTLFVENTLTNADLVQTLRW
ncbi:hypothetical protein BDK51DRAFT_37144 [Blyttiomyces helicus]|uniref:Uncharacterized protein n=1 Tax=Blyttiomyces helicus TaxID=388810 RepID=A0A4P9W140_9FUNG|nr:hypothetical protein BDK51DRAFT_37144 [Blyttiomyces helicus]|eukprot:RKO83776.1 hypothetical protein BDK51DRAFT_37144 [Blyttiomyces helicus]